jgi:hypothetical protein
MHVGTRDAEKALQRRRVTDQVDHRSGFRGVRRADRQAEDRAQVVLELAGASALDRPVAGVVHARSHLVGEQPAVRRLEELEREHAGVPELVEQPPGVDAGLGLRVATRGGRAGQPEDAVAVRVLRERIEGGLPRGAANGEDRELAAEVDQLLGDVVLAQLVQARDQTLAFAVVAEPAGLGERRQRRRLEVWRRDVQPAEEPLLLQPVLDELQRVGIGYGAHGARRRGGHVLELVGDDVGALRQPAQRQLVVVGADDELPCGRGRCIR